MRHCLVTSCLISMLASPAFAIDAVDSPNSFGKGVLGLEYGGITTIDDHHAENNLQTHELEANYGVTDHWTPGVAIEFQKDTDEAVKLNTVSFESLFQFWDPDEKWLDAGVAVEYAHSFETSTPDAVNVKLLMEKQTGKFLHRINIIAEQEIGGSAHGGPDLSVLWGTRYILNDHFKPGFEIQSDLGKDSQITGPFNWQTHYAGPAVYGKITDDISYRATYLLGVSEAATDSAVHVQLLFVKDF